MNEFGRAEIREGGLHYGFPHQPYRPNRRNGSSEYSADEQRPIWVAPERSKLFSDGNLKPRGKCPNHRVTAKVPESKFSAAVPAGRSSLGLRDLTC
jgi:hypothetical protein